MNQVSYSPAGIKTIISDAAGDDFILSSGGFAATVITQEGVEHFGIAGVDAGDTVIIASKKMCSLLGPRLSAAILAHEEAHCLLGHVEVAQKAGPGMYDSMQFELEADAYAVSKTSANDVYEGLTAAMKAVTLLYLEATGIRSMDKQALRSMRRKMYKALERRLVALAAATL